MSYDVFISYRRNGGWLMALNLYERLERAGYSTFIDRRMQRGRFDQQIYDRIDECRDFVLLLSPHALDECWSEESWVRKEIEYAVSRQKNIVPYVMNGFECPQNLPEDVVKAVMCQGAEESNAYFEASIRQLCSYLVSRPHGTQPADEPEKPQGEAEQKESAASAQQLYEQGSRLYDRNEPKEAFPLLREAAKGGIAKAQLMLGKMYEDGDGVKQDYARAAKWYQKAVEQGNEDAQLWLGQMYEDGRGVKRNYARAAELYQAAAEQGNIAAQCQLDALYSAVRLTPIEYFLAILGLQTDKFNALSDEERKAISRRGTWAGILCILIILMLTGIFTSLEDEPIPTVPYTATLESMRDGAPFADALSDGDVRNVAAGDRLFIDAAAGEPKGGIIRYYFADFDASDEEKEKLRDKCATAIADSVTIRFPDEAPGSRIELWVSVQENAPATAAGWQRYYLNYQASSDDCQVWMRATLNGDVLQNDGRYRVKPGDEIHVNAIGTEAAIERIGYYFYTDQKSETVDVYSDDIIIPVPEHEGSDKIYLYVEAIATNDNGEPNTITKTGWWEFQLLYD